MTPRRVAAVARHEFRVLRADPTFVVVMTVMPMVLMAFLRPAFRASLVAAGVRDATGAEQVVPGLSVVFALFLVGNLGFAVYREHGWGTWDRLRASAATDAEIMAGKSVVPLFLLAVQQLVLLGVGGLLFGLHVRGSTVALAAVAAAFGVSLTGLGFCLLAVCHSVMQLNAITNLGTMLLSGLGGALTPLESLPGWARAIAPGVPTYWAMRGYRSVVLHHGGLSDIALPVAVLAGYAVAFFVLALWRFRAEDTKRFWA